MLYDVSLLYNFFDLAQTLSTRERERKIGVDLSQSILTFAHVGTHLEGRSREDE